MFEGTITYNVIREFYGKSYHMNFKKIVCFVTKNYYKEDFWTDKKNKYYTRIFDFENNQLYQINYRHKSINKSKLLEHTKSSIEDIKIESYKTSYKLVYPIDFGFKGHSEYIYKTNSGVFIEPENSKYIRICSQVPFGNNEVASYFKEQPNFRYRNTKEYQLISIIEKKLTPIEEELNKFQGFDITVGKINRIEYEKLWGKKEWKNKFEKRMIDFYKDILQYDLTDDHKNNIGTFSTIHFGLMNENEYNRTNLQLRKYEREYDQ